MDLTLNEEQRQLQESVAKFVRDEYEFETRRKVIDSDENFNRDLWKTIAELGWIGMPFSEDEGGYGFSPVESMVLLEQFGKNLVVEPFTTNVLFAGKILSLTGQTDLIGQLIQGDLQLAVAYFEQQSRYNLADVTTTASESNGSYAVSGSKSVVLNAPNADKIIVSARTQGDSTDADGVSLFLVNKSDVSTRDYKTFDAFGASEVEFDNAPATLIGELNAGFAVLEEASMHAIFGLCSEAVGCMEILYKDTVEYSKTRKQFGVPIGSFQALQHRMVDMFMEYEQSKSLMYMASVRLSEGGPMAKKTVHALKAQIGKAGRLIGQEAVQIHGGMGVTDELHISHYFKRLTAINLMFGDANYHLKQFASAS